jgi:hypothetical protein
MTNVWINSVVVTMSALASSVFLVLFFFSDDRKEYLLTSASLLQSFGATLVTLLQSFGATLVTLLQSFGATLVTLLQSFGATLVTLLQSSGQGLEVLKSVALSFTVDLLDTIITPRVFLFGLSVFLVTVGFIYKQDRERAYIEVKEISSELLKGGKDAVQAVYSVLSKPVNVLSYALVILIIEAYPVLIDKLVSGALKQTKLA